MLLLQAPYDLEVPNCPTRYELLLPIVTQALWRLSEPATLASFQSSFNVVARNASSYPLLAALLKMNKRLSLIKHMVDVLEWHSLLFGILNKAPISREEVRPHGSSAARLSLSVPGLPFTILPIL
jgi:hypothetical protein